MSTKKSTLERIKEYGKSINEASMSAPYTPRSAEELTFWNQHLVIKHKELSEPTKDDKLFNATNITPGIGHNKRIADTTNTADGPQPEVRMVTKEDVNHLVSLQIRKGLAQKRIEEGDSSEEAMKNFTDINSRLRNVQAMGRTVDRWSNTTTEEGQE